MLRAVMDFNYIVTNEKNTGKSRMQRTQEYKMARKRLKIVSQRHTEKGRVSQRR